MTPVTFRAHTNLPRHTTDPCVCLADDPGTVYPGLPLPAPAAGGLRHGVPGGSVRLEEKVRLLLPAAAAGDHDRQPGPDRLDHEGYEFLPGECGQIVAIDLRCSQTTRGGQNQPKTRQSGPIWISEWSFAASRWGRFNCLSETVSRLWSAGSHVGLIKIKGKSQQGLISNKQAEVCHFQGGCTRFTPPVTDASSDCCCRSSSDHQSVS